jgi:tRNA (mo5U34)-methyltransferase
MEEVKEKSLGEKILEMPYWYHRIELPGNITPGWAPIDASKYAIPDDLTGKRVLDIGAWDGYWTWEALKRGAKEVVAIDDFSDNDSAALGARKEIKRDWQTFDICREALGFTIDVTKMGDGNGKAFYNDKGQTCFRREMSVYDISESALGRFDVVFFFGTIYHLKHPLLALEKISSICDGEIYIESAICDDFSPYRGGINKGYPNNDVVAEFYPTNEYGGNKTNWWAPTTQCLGAMVLCVGFKNIKAWGLTDKPKDTSECRGFVYGSKTGVDNPNVNRQVELETTNFKKPLTVGAVMSVPRLGFQDNSFCMFEALMPLKIDVIKMSGAFWGQCLERGIQQQIDMGFDAILTIDYDTVFTCDDVKTLIRLFQEHPEADAIVPFQNGRAGMQALMTLKTKTGQVKEVIARDEFTPDVTKIASGHFGLTLIRASSLMKLKHPWFIAQPNPDGQWGPGRIDDDIYFWKQMEKAGMTVYAANRVVIGHLELVATWPSIDLKPIYQNTADYQKNGKPKDVWV